MDPFMSRMRQSSPAPASGGAPGTPRLDYSSPFAKMGGMGARAALAQRQQPQGQPQGQPPAQATAYGLRERLSQVPQAMAGRGTMGGGWNPNAPSPDMRRRMAMDRGSRMPPPVDFGPGAPLNRMRGPEPTPPPRLPGGGFTGQGRREFPSVPPGVMEQLRFRMGGQGGGGPMAGGMAEGMAGGPVAGPYGNPFFNRISQAPGPMLPSPAGPAGTLPGPQGPIATTQPVMPPDNFYY